MFAILLHRAWLAYSSHGEWSPGLQALHPFLRTGAVSDLRALLAQVPHYVAAGLLDLGMLTLPLAATALGAGWAPFRERRFLRWLLPLLVVLLVAASLWLMRQQGIPRPGWPYTGNHLSRRGPMGQGPLLVRGPIWVVITYAAPFLAGWLLAAVVAVLARRRPDAGDRAAIAVVLLGVAQYVPSLALDPIYDRYLLVLIPAAVVAGLRWGRTEGRRAWIGLLVLVPLAGVAIEYTRAYVDRARAYWEGAEEVVEQGVPPAEISLGFEWNGAHLYLDALRTLHARPPFTPGNYPWAPLVRGGYGAVEGSPDLKAVAPPGTVVLAQRSYRPFFRRQPVAVLILGQKQRMRPRPE